MDRNAQFPPQIPHQKIPGERSVDVSPESVKQHCPSEPEMPVSPRAERPHRKKGKFRRFLHMYFLVSGIAANLIFLTWAIVKLLVYIQSFNPGL